MNPYDRLGLDPSATSEQVSAAYRRLAKETHPDLNPGDPNAARRFNEINEAYRNLTSGRGPTVARPVIRRDLSIEIPIDLATAYTGGVITIPGSLGACARCEGTGFVRTSMRISCETCGGRGELRVDRGILKIRVACGDCGGTGHATRRKCNQCGGSGRSAISEASLEIPPGCSDGSAFTIDNGATDPAEGFVGDLEVILRILPHETYRLNDDDLETTISVPVWTAALGGTVRVPGLVGSGFTLKVPPGSQPGRRFRLKGKGMPSLPNGDLIVTLAVVVPDGSGGKTKAAFEALRGALADRAQQG